MPSASKIILDISMFITYENFGDLDFQKVQSNETVHKETIRSLPADAAGRSPEQISLYMQEDLR